MTEQLLLTFPEAAARTGLGRSTLYEIVGRGEIPVVKIGRSARIPVSELEAWVQKKLREQNPNLSSAAGHNP